MLVFLGKRFLSLLFILWAAITVTFFLILLQTGGPFDQERDPPEHILQKQLEEAGYGGSLWSQYTSYMGDVLQGDLRQSWSMYKYWQVSDVLRLKLPYSIQLGAMAFVIAAVGGVLLGMLAAVKSQTWVDYGSMLGALLAISIPSFVTGPLFILFFALKLGWFPVGGWLSWKHMVLPALCLALPYVAYIARLMRGSMLDVWKQDFVRTAFAKGLSVPQTALRHALRVAILPVVSFLGPMAAHLLTGSMVIEAVFSIPGAGSLFVNSILNRDGYLLCGVVVVYSALLVFFNFVVDVMYSFLDRRIQLS